MNKGNRDYYALKWTIEDSLREGEVTQEFYDRKKLELSGKLQWIWDTEYMMDFDASTPGRVFANYITKAKKTNRIGYFEIERMLEVETVWDIGVNGTVCAFRQVIGGKHIYFKVFRQLEHCNFQKFLREKVLPFISMENLKVSKNIFPHDIKNKEWMSEENRIQVAQQLMPGTVVALKAFRKKDEAIDKTCRTFHRCFFDARGCADFIRDLSLVRYEGKDFVKTGDALEFTHSADAFVLGENYGESVDFHSLFGEDGKKTSVKDDMREGYERWCRKVRSGGRDPLKINAEEF